MMMSRAPWPGTREARGPASGTGPLYLKLQQALEGAIDSGRLKSGDALPPERDLAEYASISRVTVRKAVDELVRKGILVRRHGSGTFVAKPVEKVEQPLSRLTSFTEDMARRGRSSRAEWLERGLFTPSPDEMMMLGLPAGGLFLWVVSRPPSPASCQGRFPEGSLRPFACRSAYAAVLGRLETDPGKAAWGGISCLYDARRPDTAVFSQP